MSLVVYGYQLSAPSRAVFNLLREGKVDYTLKKVSVVAGETRKPEFLSVNPAGHVPFLIDDGFELGESTAILRYLCRSRPSLASFYSEDIKTAAVIDQFLAWAPELRAVTVNLLVGGATGNKALVDENVPKFPALLNEIARYLSKRSYIATNDHPSIADFQCYHELSAPVYMKQVSLETQPAVHKWFQAMEKRPATKSVIDDFNTEAKSLHA